MFRWIRRSPLSRAASAAVFVVAPVLAGPSADAPAAHAKPAISPGSNASGPSGAAGDADGWRLGMASRARMVAAGDGAQGARWALIELAMRPGWVTYWRWPGESGVPPDLDWTGSDNLVGAALVWPAPRRFESFGMASYGYRDSLSLAVAARPRDGAAPMTLRLRLGVAVCEDVCLPEVFELVAELAPGAAVSAPVAARLRETLAAAPADAGAAGVTLEECRLEREDAAAPLDVRQGVRQGAFQDVRVSAVVKTPPAYHGAHAVLAPPPGAAPDDVDRAWIGPGRLRIEAELTGVQPDEPNAAPTLTLLPAPNAGVGAVELRLCDG